ncbi:MAG: cell division protein FtsZ [Candidatus Micrarchaeia archaeon]
MKLDDALSNASLKIAVAGVGGGGCNTIKRLIAMGLKGPQLMAVNTDRIHLETVPQPAKRVLIGERLTKGLGAGGEPEIAAKAAELSREKLKLHLEGADILFLCAGMGGGTGTGAAPVIAQVAKEEGALVVGMVTYPFRIERVRLHKAVTGLEKLSKQCDTLVVIDNNRLLEYFPNLPIEQAFMLADEITARAIRGISDTLLQPSLINLDFADLSAIMRDGGVSMIAVGEGKGINKVEETVRNTLDHKLLDVDPAGAKGVLMHMTGGPDMTLGDANRAGEMITEQCDPDANVIWGARMDSSYKDRLEAIAIFTGLREGPAFLGSKADRDWGIKY